MYNTTVIGFSSLVDYAKNIYHQVKDQNEKMNNISKILDETRVVLSEINKKLSQEKKKEGESL